MNIVEFDNLLDKMPVVASINPVSLCFLRQPIRRFDSTHAMSLELDKLSELPVHRWVSLDSDLRHGYRFPIVRCNHDPFTPELNTILYNHFDSIAQSMLCQSQIAKRIINESDDVTVIVVLILDGLSYGDLCNVASSLAGSIEPCLVDVPTLTHIAFPNIVGALNQQHRIAETLFNKGFQQRLGFTYWTRQQNELTNQLFRSFAVSQMFRVSRFSEICATIAQSEIKNRTYIQIVRNGLDEYAHRSRQMIQKEPFIEEFVKDFLELGELFKQNNCRANLYLTSDHGLLWKSEFSPEIIDNKPQFSIRFFDSDDNKETSLGTYKRWKIGERYYYCLNYPYSHRHFHMNEQAAHGGISFQESIVPFVSVQIR
jgi:hypothetical protein